ncbi:MaoC family dehydratase N-terminal domain-containing protein [Peribacillus sp. NPDC097295]|uniref:FAS1-like dehydratase domain-containing protein n=1 Tax=Peribacillus sp. NPDC097295 TaxID=3364402 RepID=UPI003817552B
MRIENQTLLIKDAEVRQFIQLAGMMDSIYRIERVAKSFGYKTIPIPPTMPMIAYKLFDDNPWMLGDPIIHRKQRCEYHQVMYIDQPYDCILSLTDQSQHRGYTFVDQVLQIYDEKGTLCFTGTSQLMGGNGSDNG